MPKREWNSNSNHQFQEQRNSEEEITPLKAWTNENIISHIIEIKDEFDSEVKVEQSDLLKACKDEDAEKVELMLKRDVDINQQDQKGYNALMLASKEGHTETAQFLLAMQQKKGIPASMESSQYGHMNAKQGNNGCPNLI